MPSKRKMLLRPKGDWRDLASVATVLGPHAIAVVGTVVSANWAVVNGANAYLAYGFAFCGIVSYMILVFRGAAK
jgi:hypothetical protein